MATKVKVQEPTRIERAKLAERWLAKVDDSGGPRACWPWRGAKSKKRNGPRGVIRLGGTDGPILSAARVGVLLKQGARFSDEHLLTVDLVHAGGSGKGLDDCVNPAHWKQVKAKAKAKGKATTRGQAHAKVSRRK